MNLHGFLRRCSPHQLDMSLHSIRAGQAEDGSGCQGSRLSGGGEQGNRVSGGGEQGNRLSGCSILDTRFLMLNGGYSIKLAKAVASKLRKKLMAGQLNLDGKHPCPEFSAHAKHYLEDYAKTTCKRNTWMVYETIVRLHLASEWKGKKLNQIKQVYVKRPTGKINPDRRRRFNNHGTNLSQNPKPRTLRIQIPT